MNIKLLKLNENAVIPSYATEEAACLDLTAISVKVVNEKDYGYIEYGTGIALEIPKGYEAEIRPRSSISKTGMILANSPGTIDSDYRGEIFVRFKWIPGSRKYEVGERIAQMKISQKQHISFELVESLSETKRNNSGFGSTGK